MSTPDTTTQSDTRPTLGATLRQARRARKLTLSTLAGMVNCSESMLSKIERGRAYPSLRLLHALASALGVKIAALLADQPTGPVTVQHAGDRLELRLKGPPGSGTAVILQRAIPFCDGMLLDANVHVIPPGAGSEGQYAHEAEEAGYVVSGSVELTVDGARYLLTEGSTFHFNSRLPHSYVNPASSSAVIFWVNGFGS